MSLNEYSIDNAPKVSYQGKSVALTKFYFSPPERMTRHYPGSPLEIEVVEAFIEEEEINTWRRMTDEEIENLHTDKDHYQAVEEAYLEMNDPYYEW